MPNSKLERWLKWILRIVGASALTALVFVAAPYSWMDAIHQWLGMGKLPTEPVVGYLARSTSAFYAMHGGLAWLISFDLRRHRLVLVYLGAATVVFGLALWIVGWAEGLPRWWRLWEGPIDTVLGLAILACAYRIPRVNAPALDRARSIEKPEQHRTRP
jgi:hypothetical protein